MKRTRVLCAVLALAFLTGCSPQVWELSAKPWEPVTAAVWPPADRAAAEFGLRLLGETRSEGTNTLISPLSVLLALSMTANGAGGETLEAFQALLGPECTLEALNANCASLLRDYAALGGGTQCGIANSLWLDDTLTAEERFIAAVTGNYNAQLYSADLQAQGMAGKVNGWVKEHTRGKITDLVSEIPPNTVALLANAVYLKNAWQVPFQHEQVVKGEPFTLSDGTTTWTNYLNNGFQVERYLSGEAGTGVLLPYDDGRLAFLALLPEEGTGLSDCLNGLDGEDFSALIDSAEDRQVELWLPKFETEWSGNLAKPLSALGLEVAFDLSQADFSPMGAMEGDLPIYMSAVLHKTRLEVNEKGTEAAAATIVMMGAGSSGPPKDRTVLHFDRPFLYGIVDLERGVPLFLGTFEQP